jgi:hypothetical protein
VATWVRVSQPLDELAPAQAFAGEPIIGAVCEDGIFDSRDARIRTQEMRDLPRVLDMTHHAQRDRFATVSMPCRMRKALIGASTTPVVV